LNRFTDATSIPSSAITVWTTSLKCTASPNLSWSVANNPPRPVPSAWSIASRTSDWK